MLVWDMCVKSKTVCQKSWLHFPLVKADSFAILGLLTVSAEAWFDNALCHASASSRERNRFNNDPHVMSHCFKLPLLHCEGREKSYCTSCPIRQKKVGTTTHFKSWWWPTKRLRQKNKRVKFRKKTYFPRIDTPRPWVSKITHIYKQLVLEVTNKALI